MSLFSLGICITDQDGRILNKNSRLDEIFKGQGWVEPDETTPESQVIAVEQLVSLEILTLSPTLSNGEPVYNVEIDFQRLDGTPGTLLVSTLPIDDHVDRIAGAMVVAIDITQQREHTSALLDTLVKLLQNTTNYQQHLDGIPELIWTADPSGSVDYFNVMHEQYQGFRLVEDGTWRWEENIHPDDLQRSIAHAMRAVDTGEMYEVEIRIRMADGSYRWHLNRAVPVHDRHGEIIKWIGVTTDIHDLKTIELRLVKKQNTE